MSIKISYGGRHFIGNREQLEVLVSDIVPKTLEAVESPESKIAGTVVDYTPHHRLRVNLPEVSNKTPVETALLVLESMNKLDELRKRYQGKIDISYMLGRGPGISYGDLLMQRTGDFTAIYGAEDMDIRQIQPELVWMAEEMLSRDLVLGTGARPRIMLNPVPEGDVMRQLHEVWYALDAGATEGFLPDNPFGHDLSKGSSVFVGVNGKGGFGDLTSGLNLFNHRASKAQETSNFFNYLSRIVDPEMFATEYGIHIWTGVNNIYRAYASYTENRFDARPTEFSDEARQEAITRMKGFIGRYNSDLKKVPKISEKFQAFINQDNNERILVQATVWPELDLKVSIPRLTEEVYTAMKETAL
ncbi:MAG: hypothetical protein AABX59_00455 [Nanoarchaeota archaeon]